MNPDLLPRALGHLALFVCALSCFGGTALAQEPAGSPEGPPPAQWNPSTPPPPGYTAQPQPQPQPQPYAQPPAPGYGQAPQPGYPPGYMRPKVSRGLMIGGIATLGGTYGFSALMGAIALSAEDDPFTTCIDCADVGPRLFIPVFGPFIAMPVAAGSKGVYALLGMAQLAGLGMMVGGIIRYKRTKQRRDDWDRSHGLALDLGGRRRLSFDVGGTPEGAGARGKLTF